MKYLIRIERKTDGPTPVYAEVVERIDGIGALNGLVKDATSALGDELYPGRYELVIEEVQ